MSYISNQDIIDRVGSATALQLTTDSGVDTIDPDVLTEARQSAEGEANGYLGRRYAVPVNLTAHADLAATLKGFTLDIAVYRLMNRRQPVAEGHKTARDDAIRWLQLVAEGKIVLPAASTPASTTSDDPTGTWGSSDQAMTRETMT